MFRELTDSIKYAALWKRITQIIWIDTVMGNRYKKDTEKNLGIVIFASTEKYEQSVGVFFLSNNEINTWQMTYYV